MKLRCVRCGTDVPVPPEALTSDQGAVICPTCGARYRRNPTRVSGTAVAGARPGDASAVGATATPSLPPTVGPPAAPPRGDTTPLPAVPAAFTAGAVLAGRYRIVRFIARGGMGEVYEAEDLELRGTVALKTIRPRVGDDQHALERFRREIQLARRVTHPNVCRIFDVGYHELPAPVAGAEAPRVAFLTMELLHGETLGDRLRREGPLSPSAALPLLRQMAVGLQAAHRAGVIHRDFKSDNVFLVPAAEEETGVRAVIADFGIARGEDDGMARLTSTGVVGTPAYMAPEQLRGDEATSAVDVYALGLVMYETLTGRLPFTGDTSLSTAVRRLTEMPLSPRVYVPDLDRRWEAVILRCLERDPADRFRGPLEVVEALADETLPAAPTTPAATPAASPAGAPGSAGAGAGVASRRRRWLAAALVLLFAVAAASSWLRVRARRADDLVAVPVAPRRAVAVLGFRNLTGREDAAWLSTALAEMLNTELGGGGHLRVVPGESVERAKLELGLAVAEAVPAETRGRLRALLGADYLVLGSYTALGGDAGGGLRIDLRLEDAVDGEALAALAEDGGQAELFDLVRRLGSAVRERLGADAEGAGERVASSFSAEAAQLYAQGLDRLRRFEPLQAREPLERAVALDPQNPLARSALAAAWSALGYDERARAEAKRAFDLAARLPPEERLAVEGRYWEALRDWDKASEAYRALWRRFPDNVDNALRLAAAQTAAGEARDALATLQAARTLPPPARDDPRLDLAEAAAAAALSDFRRQQAAAARAAAGGERLGANLLVAQARIAECWALRNLGQPEAALAACAQGESNYAAVGDRAGLAFGLSTRAGVLYDRGDLHGARRVYEEALATSRATGDQNGVARALNNIAVVARNQGDAEEARRLYGEVLTLCRAIGDRFGAAQSLNNIAAVLSHQGDLAGARGMLEEALALRRDLADRAGEAYALANLGMVLRQQGDLEPARQALEQSLAIRRDIGQRPAEVASLGAIGRLLFDQGDLVGARERFSAALTACREMGNKSCTAFALFGLGELAATAGDLVSARHEHEAALALRTDTGERAAAAESRLALARLALEEGDAVGGSRAARAALTEFRSTGEQDDEALARAYLAQSLLAAGDAAGAGREAAAAQELAGASQSVPTRLLVAVHTGKARGGGQAVLAGLRAAAAEAGRRGFVGLALEARLAAAEVALAAGAADAHGLLAQVAQDAAARGYQRIAARATAAGG